MASRGGFTGPPMNSVVHPMNVGHAAGMRMPGMPQPQMGYPRSLNNAPQYPQVCSLFFLSVYFEESKSVLSER